MVGEGEECHDKGITHTHSCMTHGPMINERSATYLNPSDHYHHINFSRSPKPPFSFVQILEWTRQSKGKDKVRIEYK